ncbi:hypothetical protein BB561_001529 [Smittium simulii]|uniref:Uncharacterized protein n=1 Tax=Smittium simulii TaxID=133385 RepID=A0A2T9YU76_9FUNG|nr:hypothetical protein BB561_001529 [Smittium simulii]
MSPLSDFNQSPQFPDNLLLEMELHLSVCEDFLSDTSSTLKTVSEDHLDQELLNSIEINVKDLDATGSLLSKKLQNTFSTKLQLNDDSNEQFFLRAKNILDCWISTQTLLFSVKKNLNRIQLLVGLGSSISALCDNFKILFQQSSIFLEELQISVTPLSAINKNTLSSSLTDSSNADFSPKNGTLCADQSKPLKYFKDYFKKLCEAHASLNSKKNSLLKRLDSTNAKKSALNAQFYLDAPLLSQNSKSDYFHGFVENLNSANSSVINVLKSSKKIIKLYETKLLFIDSSKRIKNFSSIIQARLSELTHIHFRIENKYKNISNKASFNANLFDKGLNITETSSFSSIDTDSKEFYDKYTTMIIRLKTTTGNVTPILESLLNFVTAFENKALHSEFSLIYSDTITYWDKTNKLAQTHLKKIAIFFEKLNTLTFDSEIEPILPHSQPIELDDFHDNIPLSANQPYGYKLSKNELHKAVQRPRSNSAMSSFNYSGPVNVIKKYSNCMVLKQDDSETNLSPDNTSTSTNDFKISSSTNLSELVLPQFISNTIFKKRFLSPLYRTKTT